MNVNNYEDLQNTPVVPTGVYGGLPQLLRECTDLFTDERERDVVLFSCLAVLSGCFNDIKGKYYNNWSSPNLFGFIVAPPASLKGSMSYARLLGKPIQDNYMAENTKAMKQYETALNLWSKRNKKDVTVNNTTAPVKPKCPVLFFPGNSSAAALYGMMKESDGVGILLETEADTLANTMGKKEWGGFSDLFRKAFHHELISLSRSTNNVYLSVEQPKLSILLTGTPDQVPRMISSAEDGLFSRFLFYVYSKDLKWNNPAPCEDCKDLTEQFEDLGLQVQKMKIKLDKGGFTFKLTTEQFENLSKNFEAKLNEVKLYEGVGASSTVYRLGLIAFRIAMILTVLRHFEKPTPDKCLVCTDPDLELTLKLTDVYFQHSLLMYHMLPKHGNIPYKLREFHKSLPEGEFERKTADDVGEAMLISKKTVYNYINKLIDLGLLLSDDYNSYRKS